MCNFRLKLIQTRKFKKPAPPEGVSGDNSHMTEMSDNTGISAVLGNEDSAQDAAGKLATADTFFLNDAKTNLILENLMKQLSLPEKLLVT